MFKFFKKSPPPGEAQTNEPAVVQNEPDQATDAGHPPVDPQTGATTARDDAASDPGASVVETPGDGIPGVDAAVVDAPIIDTASTESPAPAASSGGFFSRLRQGLSRTRANLADGLAALVSGRKTIDADLLDEIETQLLLADVGIDATEHVINALTAKLKRKQLQDGDALMTHLKAELRAILDPCTAPLQIQTEHKPYVILVVGVNGVGKTTTIGKLAHRYMAENHKVMLAAGDTFRAAAVEQLQVWGQRNDVPVIGQATGSDSASVIFDAYQAAKARGRDILIADTAGRLHNKTNLMEELAKIVRVLKKQDESLPHEVLLVLDATTGQNALNQAKAFDEAIKLTGLCLTKLDGTAKGGVVFSIAKAMQLPIRFIGVGEQAEDLRPFDADDFVNALFERT